MNPRSALLTLTTVAGLALPTGCASLTGSAAVAPLAAAPPAPYGSAVSHPREDPYYPAQGDPGIDALHYDLDLTWSPRSRVLDGVATIEFRATRDTGADGTVRLDLGRPLATHEISLDGAPVRSTRLRRGDLVVTAPGLAQGSRHTLRIVYSGSPRPVQAPVTRSDFDTTGWTTLRNGQVWTMQEPWGAYTWYPVNDHPSDKAFYDARIDVPSRWTGVFNGELLANRVVGGRRITRWHLDAPAASYLTTIAIGPFTRSTQTGPHGLPLTYWVRPNDGDRLATLRRSPDLLRWLEERLGAYPFDRAGAVVVRSSSAMETQTLVTMGDDVRNGPGDYLEVLLHEYAHQWYGDTVTPNNWKDLWLNEGFAMYLEARWSADQGRVPMAQWRDHWASGDQGWRRQYGPPGEYDKDQFASINVYYCSALMLDRLRARVGGRDFARLVRAWPRAQRNGNADRGEWVQFAERVTGEELSRFVHEWLTSPTTPR
jgi:aminopeptidase N